MTRPLNILVTGSRGKIGSGLVPALEAREHPVRGYDRIDGDDIHNVSRLLDAVEGAEVVVHLAAIPGPRTGCRFPEFFNQNCVATYRVAQVCTVVRPPVRRLVFASSASYYGAEESIAKMNPIQPLREESPPVRMWPEPAVATAEAFPEHLAYGQSKVIAEEILSHYGLTRQLEIICLRFAEIERYCSLDFAVWALTKAVESERKFFYEAYNVADKAPWLDTGKIRELVELP